MNTLMGDYEFKLFTSIFGSGSHGLIITSGANSIRPISAGMFVYYVHVPVPTNQPRASVRLSVYMYCVCVCVRVHPHTTTVYIHSTLHLCTCMLQHAYIYDN